MAFSQMAHPLRWFIFILGFFIIAEVLYIFDFRLIRQHKGKYDDSEVRKKLYDHIWKRQFFELKYLVPAGIMFNVLAIGLIASNPGLFLQQNWQVALGLVQALMGAGFLINSVYSFKERSKLITQAL